MVAHGYRVVSSLNWSNSGTQQPPEWLSSHCSTHPHGMRKGLEKVPKNGLLQTTWSAYYSQRVIPQMWSNKSKKETQGDPIYSQHMECVNPPWQCKNQQTRENSTSSQRACLLQSWYSCTEGNMPSRWRTAHRTQLWLHFLLEWMQWWRMERVRCWICN